MTWNSLYFPTFIFELFPFFCLCSYSTPKKFQNMFPSNRSFQKLSFLSSFFPDFFVHYVREKTEEKSANSTFYFIFVFSQFLKFYTIFFSWWIFPSFFLLWFFSEESSFFCSIRKFFCFQKENVPNRETFYISHTKAGELTFLFFPSCFFFFFGCSPSNHQPRKTHTQRKRVFPPYVSIFIFPI